MCEYDDSASDDGSATLAPTSATGSELDGADAGRVEDLGDFLEPAAVAECFVAAVLDTPADAPAPASVAVVVCPKLVEVLASAGYGVPDGWTTLVDAVNMPPDLFGSETESIRRTCMCFFSAQLSTRWSELGPAPPAGGGGRREAAASRAGPSAPLDTRLCIPPSGITVSPERSGLVLSRHPGGDASLASQVWGARQANAARPAAAIGGGASRATSTTTLPPPD